MNKQTNKPKRGGSFSPLVPPEGKSITGSQNSAAKMTPEGWTIYKTLVKLIAIYHPQSFKVKKLDIYDSVISHYTLFIKHRFMRTLSSSRVLSKAADK